MNKGRTLIIGEQTYYVEPVDAMGLNGDQGGLHVKF